MKPAHQRKEIQISEKMTEIKRDHLKTLKIFSTKKILLLKQEIENYLKIGPIMNKRKIENLGREARPQQLLKKRMQTQIANQTQVVVQAFPQMGLKNKIIQKILILLSKTKMFKVILNKQQPKKMNKSKTIMTTKSCQKN